jgi:hypothetical protein
MLYSCIGKEGRPMDSKGSKQTKMSVSERHPVGSECAWVLFFAIAIEAARFLLGFELSENEKIATGILALFFIINIYAIFWMPEHWKELFGIFDRS